MSYSSITVQNAHGIHITGSVNTVSMSTAANNSVATYYALSLPGASSNTITQSYFSNLTGDSVSLSNGSRNNSISLSTIAGDYSTALTLNNVTSNTITQTLITSQGKDTVSLINSNFNTISYAQ